MVGCLGKTRDQWGDGENSVVAPEERSKTRVAREKGNHEEKKKKKKTAKKTRKKTEGKKSSETTLKFIS